MDKIKDLVLESSSILILAHINPDGDAIGSALSLYNALLERLYNVDVMIPNAPKKYNFLPNFDKIITSTEKEYELVIVLDTSTQDRINQSEYYFENAKYTINIDHHKGNTLYANYNYISPNSPACCEYLYYILKKLKIDITKNVATCLMCGLLTDTGGFQYSDVGEKTFQMASKLSKLTDIPSIYKKVLGTITKEHFLLSNIASNRLEFIYDGKIAYTYLNTNDLKKCNGDLTDFEGIINIGRNIEGVEASIFIRELEDCYRISLRGNGNIDLSIVGEHFNGGGHKNAAGITVKKDLPLKELKDKLINLVKENLKTNE